MRVAYQVIKFFDIKLKSEHFLARKAGKKNFSSNVNANHYNSLILQALLHESFVK